MAESQDSIVLEMKNITKKFPGVVALKDVNFQLRKGEVHVLLGENGAGKSTLIKLLTGANQDYEGEILLNGEVIRIENPGHAMQLGINAVYQEFNLIPYLDAGMNIFLNHPPIKGRIIKRIDKEKIYKNSREYFSRLGSKINPKTLVKHLGVASQQMVEISKSLASNAKILIFDEPTAVLTEDETESLFKVIRNLKSQGVAVIYISHRLEEIFQIGDRATVLRDGEYLDTVNLKTGEIEIDHIIELMVGRKLDDKFPKITLEPGKELLRVEHLNRVGVLHDISLTLREGEILGISGLVGSGRTELARAIFGADKIDSGDIYLEGKKVNVSSPQVAVTKKIGLAPEDRKTEGLIQVLPVDDNIVISSTKRITGGGVFNMKKKARISKQLVNELRIVTPDLKRKVRFLSGGNQQKVVLAKWLASESRIIIFDEPTRGIDVGAKVEVYQLMNDLLKKGVGIIMISSELPEILGMSDRIIVMHEGRIGGELKASEANQNTIIRYATGGGPRETV